MTLETETYNFKQKLNKFQLEFNHKIDELKLIQDQLDQRYNEQHHQLDMFTRESHRIDKEVQNTDFYLNKVQPISHFTNLVTMLRSVIEDEDQLARIQEMQNGFFTALAPDQEEIKQHLAEQKMKEQKLKAQDGGDDDADQAASSIEKVSPHYERISAALKEVEHFKTKERADVAPSMLVGDELSKFEGALKKIQNHREIANKYEDKRQKFSQDAEVKEESEKVIYVQGKRQTIGGVGNNDKKKSEQVMTPQDNKILRQNDYDYGSNRRSQSELNNVAMNSDNGGAISPHKVNPLALDLV